MEEFLPGICKALSSASALQNKYKPGDRRRIALEAAEEQTSYPYAPVLGKGSGEPPQGQWMAS